MVAQWLRILYDYWVMMDADLSHRPQDLTPWRMPISLSVLAGRTQGWPLQRRLMSRAAGMLAQRALGLDIRVATSGFAAFRRETVAPLLPSLQPEGFKLLLEIVVRATQARVEAPITFVERQSELIGEALHCAGNFGEVPFRCRVIRIVKRRRSSLAATKSFQIKAVDVHRTLAPTRQTLI